MRAASCFSGIGGAELALPEAEWLWCAEIEKFPSAVLAHRFGHPNLGDITASDFIERAAAFGPLDLLAGGPPCQAFSVAGLRKGMSDPRGQLSIRFLEIAHAIRPRNLAVENVPGWLNHEDNAFGCFLGGLVGADDALLPCERPRGRRGNEFWRWHKEREELVPTWPSAGMVAGPWARAAWRVLDAQYAGLAQRRERVFLVADFGDGADPVEILFERQGLLGNPPPRRETGEGVTGTLSARAQGGGGLGTAFECQGGLQPEPAGPEAAMAMPGVRGEVLRPPCDDAGRAGQPVPAGMREVRGGSEPPVAFGGNNTSGSIDVSTALTSHGGPHGRLDFESETFVLAPTLDASFGRLYGCSGQDLNHGHGHLVSEIAHTLRPEGFDASEDGSGRGTPLVPVPFSIMPMNSGKDYKARETDISQPLMAGGPVGGNQGGDYIVDQAPIAFPERLSGTQYASAEDLAPSLTSLNPTAVAFSCKDYGADAADELSPTLRAMGHADSHANAGGQMAVAFPREISPTITTNYGKQVDSSDTSEGPNVVPVAFDLRGREGGAQFEGPHDTANIRAASGGSSRSYVAEQWAVRRLTVTECCRLQGYPDDWTAIEFGSRRTVDEDEAAYLIAKGCHVVRDNEGRWRTNTAADGPQYKALGNAWAVACVRPIARNIMEAQGREAA